jgi:UDP:flavonoid glycosyltransferase YjiC (YdhE family)
MTRFLFVAPGLVGHVTPAAAVAAELQRRGHPVAWAGPLADVRHLLAPGAEVHLTAGMGPRPRPLEVRGVAALRFLWEDFIAPLAEAMVPGVEAAAQDFGAEAIVADQQALAGALVAERLRLLWATSASTSSELTDPLAAFPKVAEWVARISAGLRRRVGDPLCAGDLRFSPDLVLCYSVPELVADLPPQLRAVVRFVGTTAPPPLANYRRSARHPLVLISMGTANAEAAAPFLNRAASALGRSPARRGLIVDLLETIPDPPKYVLTRPYIAHAQLVHRAGVVVCHGGHNTVCEALAAGVPLVVAPIRDDQPITAGQVVSSGCGLRVRFDRADPPRIRAAIDTVLDDPAYRAAATRIGRSLRDAGGAASAANHLELLVGGVSPLAFNGSMPAAPRQPG